MQHELLSLYGYLVLVADCLALTVIATVCFLLLVHEHAKAPLHYRAFLAATFFAAAWLAADRLGQARPILWIPGGVRAVLDACIAGHIVRRWLAMKVPLASSPRLVYPPRFGSPHR